jgi:hypothetical protein
MNVTVNFTRIRTKLLCFHPKTSENRSRQLIAPIRSLGAPLEYSLGKKKKKKKLREPYENSAATEMTPTATAATAIDERKICGWLSTTERLQPPTANFKAGDAEDVLRRRCRNQRGSNFESDFNVICRLAAY